MFAGLSNMAKALLSAGMAVFVTIASGVEAHTPTAIYIATAVGAGIAAFTATYGAESPAVKALLAGVVNAAGSVITSWGHADTLQVVIFAVVAFASGAGFTVAAKNGPPVVAPVARGARVDGTVPARERLA
jgi:hypothetical protein